LYKRLFSLLSAFQAAPTPWVLRVSPLFLSMSLSDHDCPPLVIAYQSCALAAHLVAFLKSFATPSLFVEAIVLPFHRLFGSLLRQSSVMEFADFLLLLLKHVSFCCQSLLLSFSVLTTLRLRRPLSPEPPFLRDELNFSKCTKNFFLPRSDTDKRPAYRGSRVVCCRAIRLLLSVGNLLGLLTIG